MPCLVSAKLQLADGTTARDPDVGPVTATVDGAQERAVVAGGPAVPGIDEEDVVQVDGDAARLHGPVPTRRPWCG